MAEQTADNEPSMEEILSSIRRIINEDDEEAAPEAEAEAAAPEPAPAEDEPQSQDDIDALFGGDDDAGGEDVLELTEKVDDADAGTDPMAMDDDLMIVDREEEEEPVAMAEPEPEPEIDFNALEEEVSDGIMSEPAATAAMGSFHTLADQIRISEEEGRTLEGVVRALLRPMLKEWLDANLPSIVDEKVQAEIDRVSRRRR
ncbi:DUF2497 domain-containing protein [Maricaulis parjimensis]|uniref:DUF2497 domain-containing protein n=1 Tax=Maricaulis parjimensis TaxID=144023 RepID=UPI001939F639|nr:DUF2497 domain-containing protein [Maricaulis parjimensis]